MPSFFRPLPMPLFAVLMPAALLMAGLAAGCTGKVFRHSGAVNVGGGMTVDGKLDMGELKTSVSLANNHRSTPLSPVVVSGDATSGGSVAVLDVDDYLVDRNIGGIGSSGENPVALFREKIKTIERDPSVKAVVLRINSPGGGVTASDVMCHELTELKRKRDLPIVACIGSVGAGGAYYLASHCDAIIAHPTSIVGGVGVILNRYNLQDTMGQFNILSTPVKSGEFIDAATPERAPDEEEMAMLQQIADMFHQRFIDQVQSLRPAMQATLDQWSDGSIMTGTQAKAIGMVDQVGYFDAALHWAKLQADLPDDPRTVLYRRQGDAAYTVLDVSPNQPALTSLFPIRIPGLDRSSMPMFLYLWQADPAMAVAIQP